jgi:hypothetical protein
MRLFLALINLERSDLVLNDLIVGVVVARTWCPISVFWLLGHLNGILRTFTTDKGPSLIEARAGDFNARMRLLVGRPVAFMD